MRTDRGVRAASACAQSSGAGRSSWLRVCVRPRVRTKTSAASGKKQKMAGSAQKTVAGAQGDSVPDQSTRSSRKRNQVDIYAVYTAICLVKESEKEIAPLVGWIEPRTEPIG